ncbi:MAG: hypothetical protein L0Y72_23725 [Gemmataceae bacterium]|nr:hypothetical protein [Gemmataceae bacterium]MCI0742054.1 hypothetical protein [Gemmataceae bacterium]
MKPAGSPPTPDPSPPQGRGEKPQAVETYGGAYHRFETDLRKKKPASANHARKKPLHAKGKR